MDVTRRSALRLGVVVSTSLAGCSGVSPLGSGETATSSSYPLTFSAAASRQASADAPALVTARLTNRGHKRVQIGYGPTLMFTDNADPTLTWADDIVIAPTTNVRPWDDPVQTEDDCWRFPKDNPRPIQSILNWTELPPDSSLSEAYNIYTYGESSPCLPPGSYRFQDKGYFESESQPMVLTLVVEINDEHRVSASAEPPIIETAQAEE